MRQLLENVLTAEEAGSLQVGRVDLNHPLVERLRDLMPGDVVPEAYARVERKADGHGWHVDTGDGGHMPWCRYSGSVLLSPPDTFTGGTFRFRNPAAEYRHYLSLLIYSSDQEHRVDPHVGDRRVLLIFLGANDGI